MNRTDWSLVVAAMLVGIVVVAYDIDRQSRPVDTTVRSALWITGGMHDRPDELCCPKCGLVLAYVDHAETGTKLHWNKCPRCKQPVSWESTAP